MSRYLTLRTVFITIELHNKLWVLLYFHSVRLDLCGTACQGDPCCPNILQIGVRTGFYSLYFQLLVVRIHLVLESGSIKGVNIFWPYKVKLHWNWNLDIYQRGKNLLVTSRVKIHCVQGPLYVVTWGVKIPFLKKQHCFFD